MASEGTICGSTAIQRLSPWASGVNAVARKSATPTSPVNRQSAVQAHDALILDDRRPPAPSENLSLPAGLCLYGGI